MYTVIAIVVLFAEIAALQYTMVASAVSRIAPSFPGTGAGISWMIIIFGLVGGATTPVLGKLSDLWGKRRVMLLSAVSFAVGTLICALTSSWGLFLLGRGLEAVAICAPNVAYGLFRDVLPRRHIPAAVGMVATGLGLSAVAAPLLGGWMLDHFSWRAIFWFLLAFVCVMIPLLVLVVPESRLRVRQRLDVAGAVLLSGGVALVLMYLSNGAEWGWSRPSALAWLIGGALALAVFVAWERRVAEPLIDLGLLFSPRLGLALLAALLGSVTIGVQGYAVPYMMQTPKRAELAHAVAQQLAAASGGKLTPARLPLVHIDFNAALGYGLGATLLGYGLASAIFSGGLGMIGGAGTGEWARWAGPRRPLLLAMASFTVAPLLYAFFSHSTWQYVLCACVFGVGYGAFYSSVPNLVVEAVPASRQGISSAMFGVVTALATSVGTAVLSAFLSAHPARFQVRLPGVPASASGGWHPLPGVYADAGYRWGLLFGAAAGLLGLVVALLMRHGRAPATGGRAQPEPDDAARTEGSEAASAA
ncbi:MFS transporter [Phaeacidiphilus oryzae]|uniref:MFS transporter n=1 Tax=Phaeacidiphilus oryzae TaxID=348818 RepID=UPI00068A1520|nr:MFS transporter [Phaeacidiphilus oryzae]